MNKFEEMKLNAKIIQALIDNEISEPTQIQEEAIPLLMEGLDVIGQAQTGTGKTFAYAIPLLEQLDMTNKQVQALVMCPTRELSLQVSVEIQKLAKNLKVKTATIYGGESYEKQFKELRNKPSVIIGTPGRIIDHLNRGTLSFGAVKYLVLDEADEMLKMGFQEDMEFILSKVPDSRQTALFSATLPPFIKKLSQKYMQNPQMVKIKNKTLTVEKIAQQLYFVKKEQKKDLLLRVLDFYQFKSAMIFANTKAMVDELVLFLQENRFKADGLHGDLKQNSRDRVMQAFRLQSVEILIATDVAARGIDVEGVEAIINFDLPLENEIYVHRIGRTGRAGKTGMAITFATTRQNNYILELEEFTKSKMIRAEIPSAKQIKLRNQKAMCNLILENLEEASSNHTYDNLLIQLSKATTNPTPIIIRLLELLDAKEDREYAPIDAVSPKSKGRTGKPVSKGKSNTAFVYVWLNVGSADGIRPNQLVNYLHDELKVHREHFGKILIQKNKTYLEVNEQALRFFKELNKKRWNGKKLTYQLAKTMPSK